MNRRNFFSKLVIGAAVIAVAPQVLIPKEEPLLKCNTGGLLQWIKETNEGKHPFHITDIEVSQWGGWYQEQEALASLELQKSFERLILFGERKADCDAILKMQKSNMVAIWNME